jgi:hypothetical protein
MARSTSPAARSSSRLSLTPQRSSSAATRVPHSVVGGTGVYQNARGNATVQVPPDVPNLTDANIVINLTGG